MWRSIGIYMMYIINNKNYNLVPQTLQNTASDACDDAEHCEQRSARAGLSSRAGRTFFSSVARPFESSSTLRRLPASCESSYGTRSAATRIATLVTALPALVTGTMSPYPTLLRLTVAKYSPSKKLSMLGFTSCSTLYIRSISFSRAQTHEHAHRHTDTHTHACKHVLRSLALAHGLGVRHLLLRVYTKGALR